MAPRNANILITSPASSARDSSPGSDDCRRVRTAWLPEAYVPRIEVGQVESVERGMEALGAVVVLAYATGRAGQGGAVGEDPVRPAGGGAQAD